eukprot:gene26367-32940_t
MKQYTERFPRAIRHHSLVDTLTKVKKFLVGRQFFTIFVGPPASHRSLSRCSVYGLQHQGIRRRDRESRRDTKLGPDVDTCTLFGYFEYTWSTAVTVFSLVAYVLPTPSVGAFLIAICMITVLMFLEGLGPRDLLRGVSALLSGA